MAIEAACAEQTVLRVVTMTGRPYGVTWRTVPSGPVMGPRSNDGEGSQCVSVVVPAPPWAPKTTTPSPHPSFAGWDGSVTGEASVTFQSVAETLCHARDSLPRRSANPESGGVSDPFWPHMLH